jgi:hypothetical protein
VERYIRPMKSLWVGQLDRLVVGTKQPTDES